MKLRIRGGEDGQALAQTAITMMLLLAIVSLAIDVGLAYAERRHMQNAADAGALAGAWELCFGDPAQWQSTALDYLGYYVLALSCCNSVYRGLR